MTGRSLSIEGAFSLDWSSNPILIAEDIYFSNPPWAKHTDLAKVDKFEVSLDLFSIFKQPIRVNYITVDGLVVALEEHESGETSWDVLPGDVDAGTPDEASTTELPVSIDRLILRDFTLLHEASDRTVPLDFHLEQLELIQTEGQQLEFSTDGRFGGEQFDLAGNLGPINELLAGGKTSHDIRLTLGEVTLQSQGRINQSSTLSGANIKLVFSGPEFEWILTQLALPEFSHGDFDFRLDLQTEGGQTRLDLDGDLGSLQANARGSYNQTAGTAELIADIAGGDLGGLLEVAGVTGLPRAPFSLKVDISRSNGLTQLQSLVLETGENNASVSGLLGAWPELKGTDLLFSLDGPDVSVWSPILQLENLPARPFSLHGSVSPIATGLAVEAVRLELGNSFLVVDGSVGELPDFSGTQLSLDAAGPSLADFQFLPGLQEMPDLPFQINGEIGMQNGALTFKDMELGLGDNFLRLSGRVGLNNQLEGTDVQTHVDLPNLAKIGLLLGVEGLPGQRLSMTGNYQRVPDGWAFQLSNGSFAGASFGYEGKYTTTNGRQVVEANSHLTAPDLAALAHLAGIDNLPELPIDIMGFARYDAGEVELRDMHGTLGDTQFMVSTKVLNSPTWSGSEITLSVTGQDLGQLLVDQGFEYSLPFSLLGSVAVEDTNYRLSHVKASLGSLQVSANGVMGKFEHLAATDLQLSIAAPSLKNIGEFLNFPLPDEAFSLSTRFQGSPSVFHAEKLEISLGPSDLAGEVSVDLSGKTDVNGVFNSNYLDLAWLQNAIKERSPDAKPESTVKPEFLIPDKPIVLSQLDRANGDIEIKANKVKFLYRQSTDVYLHARVRNGNLYLDPLQTRGEDGGLLRAKLAVERDVGSEIASVDLSFAGDGVQLGIGQYEGQDPSTFRKADVAGNLSGIGATYQELARSLNGRVEVVQGPGLTGNSGLGLIFGNFMGEILSLLNPFSKTEKFTVNECAVTVVNIDSGVITVDPVVSQTEKMTMVAKGVIDLNTEKVQFTFNTKLRKGIGISASMVVNPFVSITGTLMSPVIGLDPAAVAVKGTVAVATLGISLLVKSLADRYFSSKDPCGDALKKSRKQLESLAKEGKTEK